ncbi:MAG TPA: hypothetical protein VFE46_01720 [Pirellulales bacterium]|jgi:hypothetical protein|nr:hypothetical protein [Pirellulales bacterium]
MRRARFQGQSRLIKPDARIRFDDAAKNIIARIDAPEIEQEPDEDDSIEVLSDLLGGLSIDSRGTPPRDLLGRHAKQVAFAALGMAAFGTTASHPGRHVASVRRELEHLLPSASHPHVPIVERLIRELGNPGKTAWFDGQAGYGKLVRDFLDGLIGRREIADLSRVAIPLVAGIHHWPRSTALVKLRLGLTHSYRREWSNYFRRAISLIRSAALAMRREIEIEIAEIRYLDAHEQFLSGKVKFDIILLDQPWLPEYLNSPLYSPSLGEPLPFSSNSTVLVINPQQPERLVDIAGEEAASQWPMDAFQRLVSARKTPALRPAFSANHPHALAALAIQMARLQGATTLETEASLRSTADLVRELSIVDPFSLDPIQAVHMVAQGAAAWTIGFLSHVGIARLEDDDEQTVRRLRLLSLPHGIDGSTYLAVRADSKHPRISKLIARTLVTAIDPSYHHLTGHQLPSHYRAALRRAVKTRSRSESVLLDRTGWTFDGHTVAVEAALRTATPRFDGHGGFASLARRIWDHYS